MCIFIRFIQLIVALILVGLLSLPQGMVLAAGPHPYSDYDQSLFLDVEWYRASLIASADLWNGGLDGQSGMGAYDPEFSGFFYVNLDQKWRQMPLTTSTSIAQSRAIYMNVEAYRAAGPAEGERFLQALNTGVEFLLTAFHDAEYGGFFWEVNKRGVPRNEMKHGYGNVHPLFALAQAYSVTHNPDHLVAALEQLEVIRDYFLDPAYRCAIGPGFSRDFSEQVGVNNVDVFTHWFEALLSLYDVTEGEQQAKITQLIADCGDFLATTLYQDQAGFTDRGYVAYNYDEAWRPSQLPYSRETQWAGGSHATTGHNIELAYLLSRAVERGFDETWLGIAEKLLKFCEVYAIDPSTGGMLYEVTDYAGQPLAGNPDNQFYVWWAQAETARALLHFLIVRGVEDYAARFKQIESLFHLHLTDQAYGGLFHGLDASQNLAPVGLNKADVWKVNYHYAMFFAEALRLGAKHPHRLEEL